MSNQAKFLAGAIAVYLLLGFGFCLDSAPLGDEALAWSDTQLDPLHGYFSRSRARFEM